jgi:hypothetical protein
MVSYDDTLTLYEARSRYFEDNGFGQGGGYSEAWVKFKVGGVPIAFPNHPARVRAVRIHDLHHILTGYDTSFQGEAEISAFEIGASCADYAAAWLLNLSTFFVGLFTNPRTVFSAFRRGRRCRSLYHQPFDEELLRESVGVMRARQGLDAPPASVTLGDCATFGVWCGVAALLSLPMLALLLSPLLALAWWIL